MVGLLLPRGASSAKVDWQCWTAYDVAIFAGHRQVACRLEKLAERSSSVAPSRRHPRGGYCNSRSHASWPKQRKRLTGTDTN
jgi:hypothetical protein